MDIAARIHDAPGFVHLLGPEVLSTDPALLRLDAGPQLHNHVGGPHAAAIFGLGETTAFVVLLHVFGDLVDDERFVHAYRWALRSLHGGGARATLHALVQ